MFDFFERSIREAICPSTGCTEPVALALNAATARSHAGGEIRAVRVTLDEYLFKNAVGVGIPGVGEGRGVALCIAAGLICGDPALGMNVLSKVTPEGMERACSLLPLISVETRGDIDELFVETVLETSEGRVRVVTLGSHDNIAAVQRDPAGPYIPQERAEDKGIQRYDLKDFLDFADNAPVERLAFLKEGVAMNDAIAKEGSRIGLGRAIGKLLEEGRMDNSPVVRAQFMAASASYARMSGMQLPVMTATGSGNQGITLTVTLHSAASSFGVSEEKFLRALALAHLVNIYAKSYIGALSAICACGVASGLGASVGIVYMLGGGENAMLGTMKNILGSVSGMICDGAKEGCANKVALSSSLAVQSALLALSGAEISPSDGILDMTLSGLFTNLRHLINAGMNHTNRAIVDIMTRKMA